MSSAAARKKRITGTRGRMTTNDPPVIRTIAEQTAIIRRKYGSILPAMMVSGPAGVERRISPRRSIRSFAIDIIANWEVKYRGKIKTKI